MNATLLFQLAIGDLSPPLGSKNITLGCAIEGPGGRWIPCVTETPSGDLLAGLFQVGKGRKQVCLRLPMSSSEEAFNRAVNLASEAAA